VIVNGNLTVAELQLNGGTLSGHGRITGSVTNNAGIVQAGHGDFNYLGTVLNGAYTQGANGELDIAINSYSDFGRLTIYGDVTLDGLLLVDISPYLLTSGYLQTGRAFDLLSVQNGILDGTFSQVQFNYEGGELPFGHGWNLIYGSNGIELVWGSATDYGPLAIAIQEGTPLPTDFNDLSQGLSPEVASLILQNHPDVDLTDVKFDVSDYTPPNYEAQSSVPEPSSLLLLMAGMLAGAKWLKRSAE